METEVAADALVKNGKNVYGPDQQTRFLYEVSCLDHSYVGLSLSNGIPVIDQELEKGSTNLLKVSLWMPI